MILAALVVAHLLADFTFQTNYVSEKKQKDFRYLLQHILHYAIAMLITLLLTVQTGKALISFLLVSASHALIDYIHIRLKQTKYGHNKGLRLLMIDQLLHIALITITVYLFRLQQYPSALAQWCVTVLTESVSNRSMRYLLLFVLLLDPASVFIRQLFDSLNENKRKKEEVGKTILSLQPEDARAGQLIGKLERILIAILVINNQIGAIGFVLTAKSLARYKQLEEKGFAEKYLVGTLASTAFAIVAAIVLK